jgi:hypothetical protein
MSLRTAFPQRPLTFRPPPDPSRLAELDKNFQGSEGAERRPTDLDDIGARFMEGMRSGREPSRRDWNRIVWCIWTTTPAISSDRDILDAVLRRVAGAPRARQLRRLGTVYLTEYAESRPSLDLVAQVLRERAAAAGPAWSKLGQCGAFDGRHGPARVAELALNAGLGPRSMLESIGIEGPSAESAFAEAVHSQGLARLRAAASVTPMEHLDTIRLWSLVGDDLAFPAAKTAVARALIMPFASASLATNDRRALTRFVLDHFDDPRSKPQKWIGMDDAADVVRRWLVEQSLRQFLEVVDRVASPDQWQYRRAFWMAIHEAGLIDDAYVVFDPAGAAEAERRFRDDAPFGRLKSGDGQIQPGHSVLVMRIGNAVVADWSHNGRCNIWERPDDPSAPKLHRASYFRSDLRKDLPNSLDEQQRNTRGVYTHSGAPNYLWQTRVADHISRLTGVRVNQQDYWLR